jgi:hypothetical protein
MKIKDFKIVYLNSYARWAIKVDNKIYFLTEDEIKQFCSFDDTNPQIKLIDSILKRHFETSSADLDLDEQSSPSNPQQNT